ncbi:MAG: indolepyruvate ferredoxin oxidoreductase family protein [Gammaproteobacteria bacterium]|nr:indolepyruvate ferredoxin oxidoreductase family protein [Gammaproteobacteria bacterium]
MQPPRQISLEDKYAFDVRRAYLTGIEALVRLPMLQRRRDAEAGLNTAGFISGYRGSPLGTLDQSLWRASAHLERHQIRFQPGVNEDLAATAVWGTQQAHLFPRAKYDGVFAMWYGKGPGLDRSMDVVKHANAFGVARHGGVLAIAGDDHACKSSTVPHQSEHMFIGAAVPVLNPAGVQEVLDFGLYGWALSRYCGCWVGLKAITESMDSAVSADLDAARVSIKLPEDFEEPPGGLNAQWPAAPLEQEELLHQHRVYAALAFARANRLNIITHDSDSPQLGIVTTGKSHLDVLEAFDTLGLNEARLNALGVRVYKAGMSWPLEPVATHAFAQGVREILVVEEKRAVIENQITAQLYNWPVAKRPRVVGEFDECGRGPGHDLISNLGELAPAAVARAIGRRILRFHDDAGIRGKLEYLDAAEKRHRAHAAPARMPYFCSGCPHNTSTRVPDGAIGMAGIGCHYMARWMHRNTEVFTQMGGEGASWLGIAPFTETEHVFQNLGDGTYFHSGLLAIRAAVAARVNITYKLLVNDAVAMTGGQPPDGALGLRELAAELQAEGVARLAVVAEDARAAKSKLRGLHGVRVHARRDFDKLQEEFRHVKGASVIIYDQTCAAEKRRRRKRGTLAQSDTRVFINADVCEGCGDCGAASNCLSVLPTQTEFGVKRRIDQSACNHDFSCLDGLCPSFVTVRGAKLASPNSRGKNEESMPAGELPPPECSPQFSPEKPWNILLTGIGGTGVLTAGSLLALAAHLEGKGCSTLNQTGLAQKFGAVVSHVRIAREQARIHAPRISDGGADLLLGCDLAVAASQESLARLDPARSHAVVNSYEAPTADFLHDPDYRFPGAQLRGALREETAAADFVDATRIARDLLGDSIGGNLFLIGFALQRGLIPLGAESIERAIELNAVAVEFNRRAFAWGRRAAADLKSVERRAGIAAPKAAPTLDEIIARRRRYLRAYQNERYAARYAGWVARVRAHEGAINGAGELPLTEAVARNYFKLLAYKDEYEVARLYSNGDFAKALEKQFARPFRLQFHLVPPWARQSGEKRPRKWRFPAATLRLFALLARLKFLRGGIFDPFGRSAERREERALIGEYEADLARILRAGRERHAAATALAALPEMVRGFGGVKMANIARYRAGREELRAKLGAQHA